jgi:hypothetical protein
VEATVIFLAPACWKVSSIGGYYAEMGFRKDKSRFLEWTKWLGRHRDELISCGLPDFLYADENRWFRFIGHGIDGETGWQPEALPSPQLRLLRSFLSREYPLDSLPDNLRPTS